MSDEDLSIDPEGAFWVSTDFGRMLAQVAAIGDGAERDARLGEFVDELGSAKTMIDEIVEEMGYVETMLTEVAAAAQAGDVFNYISLVVPGSAFMEARTKLRASLSDDVGSTPIDFDDPEQIDSRDDDVAHFGYLPLFAEGGPTADDIAQGQTGDCALLATLGSIASVDPQRIVDMITDHGDGSYTVYFPDGDITVDDQLPFRIDRNGRPLPTYANDFDGAALWPAILEKAFAIRSGGSYEDIAGGLAADSLPILGSDVRAVRLNLFRWPDPSDESVYADIESQLAAGLAVVATSHSTMTGSDTGLRGKVRLGSGHAWSVTRVFEVGGVKYVEVRNPWGNDGYARDENGNMVYQDRYGDQHGRAGTNGDSDESMIDLGVPGDGVIVMTVAAFTDNFFEYEVEVPPVTKNGSNDIGPDKP